MIDPNVSRKIEGHTPLPKVNAGEVCSYCGSQFIHNLADPSTTCIVLLVDDAFREMDLFWPWFPVRGPFTTFDQHYGGA